MLLFSALVFVSFFVIALFCYVWSRRGPKRDAEVRAGLEAAEEHAGMYGAITRVSPVAVLVMLFFAALAVTLLLVVEYLYDSTVLVFVMTVAAIAWVLSTAVLFLAGYFGRPAFLIHPALRNSRRS